MPGEGLVWDTGVRGPGCCECHRQGKRPGYKESINSMNGQRPGGQWGLVTKSYMQMGVRGPECS